MNLSKKLTTKQKAKIGASIGLVVFVVVLEKKRVASLMLGATSVYNDGVTEAFDEGVKYGLGLIGGPVENAQYAFSAFDQARAS